MKPAGTFNLTKTITFSRRLRDIRNRIPGRLNDLSSCKVLCMFILMAGFMAFTGISCNPEEWEMLDCSECYAEEPFEAELNVKLTINNLNPGVVLRVYSGKIEEEILILADTVSTGRWSTILPVNEYYTVTATYRAIASTYMVTAIDGNLVRTRKVRSVCDQSCWVVRGNNFNVRLRY